MRLGLIGGGPIGEGILAPLLNKGGLTPADLVGSGPAFIFLVMEALTDAGVHIGLRRDLAIEMVTQTVLGTARLAQETGRPFSELRHMVTSPAGTTAEGLRVLENARVRAAVIEAIIATYEKAKTLGG